MSASISVDVVIPTFNRRADLLTTLDALAAQNWPHDRITVHVIDNGSTDGTDAALAAAAGRWPFEVVHVRNAPRGPAFARNVGASRGHAPFVAFVDSDVSLAPDWLAGAIAIAAADASIGMVGGKVLYDHAPDRLNAFGGELGAIGLAWDALEGEVAADFQSPTERLWINCTACLVRREALDATGGFDSDFFYGYEDCDLGWRTWLAGWRAVVAPELNCRHRVGAVVGLAAPQIVFHYSKNRLRSLLRNRGASRLAGMLCGYLLYTVGDAVLRGPRWAKLRALAWNLRHLSDTLVLRRVTQTTRQIAEPDIDAMMSARWFPPRPLGGLRRRLIPGTEIGRVVADDRIVPR